MLLPLVLFIASAVLLFLSSRALMNHFLRLFRRLSGSREGAVNLLFFLLLPGTLIHELSHLLVAEILQVPTGELSLKPHLEEDQLKLGSAQVGLTDPIRLTLIGTAPFITGTIILWLIFTVGLGLNLEHFSFSALSNLTDHFSYWFFLWGYLIFAVSNTMFSSPSDLQSAALPVVLLLLALGVFQLTSLNLPVSLINISTNLFWLLTLIFTLVLVLNLILLLPLRLSKR